MNFTGEGPCHLSCSIMSGNVVWAPNSVFVFIQKEIFNTKNSLMFFFVISAAFLLFSYILYSYESYLFSNFSVSALFKFRTLFRTSCPLLIVLFISLNFNSSKFWYCLLYFIISWIFVEVLLTVDQGEAKYLQLDWFIPTLRKSFNIRDVINLVFYYMICCIPWCFYVYRFLVVNSAVHSKWGVEFLWKTLQISLLYRFKELICNYQQCVFVFLRRLCDEVSSQ